MDNIKKHFDSEANEFDELIIKLIPYYNQMLEALMISIPFSKDQSIKVMDLGCGTGTVSKLLKDHFKHAEITCLDLSDKMINMARQKLKAFQNTRFIVKDFYQLEFDDSYDVIVSSLALHHLINDQDKITFYKKIYHAIHKRGVFINADNVLASHSQLNQVYINQWIKQMEKNVSIKEIEEKWLQKHYEEDKPAILLDQLQWLKEIGFKNVDVMWKYYNFAVYGGCK